METIKNYLETMFANYPDTEETRRAKQELLTMMEDKYNELLESGMPRNEVIGTIITEFGNLDEIADTLELNRNDVVDVAYRDSRNSAENADSVIVERHEVVDTPVNKRLITMEEANDYVMDRTFSRFLLGLGVFFCILAPAGPVLGSGFYEIFGANVISNLFEGIGVAFLFISVGVGVGFIIMSGTRMKEWKFLRKETCYIDQSTEEYFRNENALAAASRSMMLALGIVLCVVCVVPVVMFGIISISTFLTAAVGPSLIFVLCGMGVFFILNASRRVDAYEKLLSLHI